MNKEQIIAAAEATLAVAREFTMENTANDDAPFMDFAHLEGMVVKMATFEDLGKLNRWLGWIQAAVYNHCSMTECVMWRLKEINLGQH